MPLKSYQYAASKLLELLAQKYDEGVFTQIIEESIKKTQSNTVIGQEKTTTKLEITNLWDGSKETLETTPKKESAPITNIPNDLDKIIKERNKVRENALLKDNIGIIKTRFKCKECGVIWERRKKADIKCPGCGAFNKEIMGVNGLNISVSDNKTIKANQIIKEGAAIDSDNPKKILVQRDMGLGDLIMLIPSITMLKNKYPDTIIDLVTKGVYKQMMEPYFNTVYSFEDNNTPNDYDKIINLLMMPEIHNNHMMIPRVNLFDEGVGVNIFDYNKTHDSKLFKENIQLDNNKFDYDKPIISICTSSSRNSKDWPHERWEDLITRMSDKYSDHIILIHSNDKVNSCPEAAPI